MSQHLPERTRGNHHKADNLNSSSDVTKFREPHKTDSLKTKGNFIKNSLTWFSKQKVRFYNCSAEHSKVMPLGKKFPNLK